MDPVELSKDLILNSDDLKVERVLVKEWGGYVYLHTLMGKERDQFENSVLQNDGKVDVRGLRARLIIYAVRDATGKPIFTMDDLGLLQKKSSAVMQRLFAKIKTMNAIGDEEVEEMVKNSGADQN